MSKYYDLLVNRPNKWYDTLQEPKRLLVFFVPILVLSMIVNILPPIWALMVMALMAGIAYWRYHYLNAPKDKG